MKTSKTGRYNLAFENTETPTVAVIKIPYDNTIPPKKVLDDKIIDYSPPSYDDATQEQGPQRDQWNNQLEFLLSCVSMSVGLGNVWRFPFVAYENGGGAFLIPYLIVLFLIGKPLYFMELSLGQFSSYGAVKVWKCVPIFKGVGFGQAITTFYVATYYNSLMATCVFYLASCFSSILPWTQCDESWGADEHCFENSTRNSTNGTETIMQSPAEQYYNIHVLKMSERIEDVGYPDWRLALCLLFCWIVLFFCLIRGVKSSGKTTYFTAFFPYIILITLLIVGCTLDGAKQGILFFVTPQWDSLLNAKVWFKACEQSFFSLAVGFGNLTMFSSYNPFRHNVYKDAMIVSILDTFTSLLAGFTIFAILGSMAAELGVDVKDVVSSGAGLAFVAYPQALSSIPVPQLWTVLFFLMLFTLGIGSSVSQVGNVLTVIYDQFPSLPKWKAGLVISVLCYCIGILYVTPGGQYIQNIMDSYGAGFTVFIFAVVQTIAVNWIYGVKRFCSDIEFMLGRKVGFYWIGCWFFIIPVSLLAIFIYSLVTLQPLKLGKYEYPVYCNYIGWAISITAVGQIPIWAVITVYRQKGSTLWEKFTRSLQPAEDWGPRNSKDRMQWKEMRNTSK